ncbi:MAG: SlyX family protein [Nannocystaceae bacterium]
MPDVQPPREQPGSEVEVRLSELEIRSEFQSKTVDDLDTVVREFAQRVDRLEHELKELRRQLESLTGGGDALTVDDDAP